MSADYDKGYRGDPMVGVADTAEYERGVADRQAGASRGRMMDTTRVKARAAEGGYLIVKDPVGSLASTIRWLVVNVVAAAAIGAAAALILHQPVQQWALVAGLAWGAIYMVMALAIWTGAAIGSIGLWLPALVRLPFSLWRWLIFWGGIGAALGFFAVSGVRSTARIQQDTITYALLGVAVGFLLGASFRLLRAVRRRVQSRSAPPAGG